MKIEKREKWTPRKYQKRMVRFLVDNPAGALLADPGLGKTSATLYALNTLRKAKAVGKVLLIAPKRVCYMVWSQEEGGEIARWKDFADLRVALLHGKEKEDAIEEDADLYVINPDGLPWLIHNGHLNRLFRRGVDTLLVDELSQYKTSGKSPAATTLKTLADSKVQEYDDLIVNSQINKEFWKNIIDHLKYLYKVVNDITINTGYEIKINAQQ